MEGEMNRHVLILPQPFAQTTNPRMLAEGERRVTLPDPSRLARVPIPLPGWWLTEDMKSPPWLAS